jgi:glycosyltransferase involved in cell wall biosynthesis
VSTEPPEAQALQTLADHAVQAAPDPALGAIVVVPARDEASRIAGCLQALSAQLDMVPGSYEVIVVLDGCRDDTLQVIQQTARRLRQPTFHTVTLLRPGGVGRARRLGMDIACQRLMQIGREDGLIASTDADTTVACDWLSAQLALAAAAD